MAERLVIVIEYEAREDLDEFVDPLNEATIQLRTWIDDHKQQNFTPVQVYAAIKDDADRVLAVFES
jgi:hypothetical protein